MKIFSDELPFWRNKHQKVKMLVFIFLSVFSVLGIAYAADKVFFIDPSGNVGIGTDSPTTKLDVRGNVDVSGNVDVEGVIFGKINVIGTWEIKNNKEDKDRSVVRRSMTEIDKSVCFLTSVYGNMNSDKTIVAILKGDDERIDGNDDYWYLYRHDSGNNKVKASAICIGTR